MKQTELSPPQPIPYPHHPLLRRLYRLPIGLYRLGLGPLIGKYILILSTFGRKTGKIRRTPVEYYRQDGQLYIMSGFGSRPDWYKNLQSNPHAGINIGNEQLCMRAGKPQTAADWDGAIAFLKSSPVTDFSTPGLPNRLESPQARKAIKNWPILMLDPTNGPCPSPLEKDLVWVWPVIFLAAGLLILVNWPRRRRK